MSHVGIWRAKLGFIPNIECFHSELELFRFRDGNLLEQRHVPQRDPRRSGTGRRRAISKMEVRHDDLVRRGDAIASRIDPMINRLIKTCRLQF